jgi:Mg2+ and Co2+ transporter CorA
MSGSSFLEDLFVFAASVIMEKKWGMGVLVFRDGGVTVTSPRLPASSEVVWLHRVQLSPDENESLLGRLFACHPLVVEDVLHFG